MWLGGHRAKGTGRSAKFILPCALCPLLFVIVASVAAQSPRTVWDGVYSDAQAKRGRELYNSKCLSCHGADLSGGEMAPPLVGIGFQSNWNGLSAGDLSERIRVSMPLGAEGSLSRQQVSDIVAAIFAAGDYPAGANELPRESDVLKTIQITPRK
jgi:mono/diheme cytochrome c family protein